MASVLNSPILVLNKRWHPIHVMKAKDALSKAVNENAMFMDETDSVLYSWEDWVDLFSQDLEYEGGDFKYIAAGKYKVRLPEIIVLNKYDKIPKVDIKLTRRNLLIRDKFTCQYTFKKLSLKDATIDHVIPRAQGGKTTWDNVVICDWRINSKKANRTPKEAGLPWPKPKKPNWHPLFSHFVQQRPKSWEPYINTSEWNEIGYWDVPLID